MDFLEDKYFPEIMIFVKNNILRDAFGIFIYFGRYIGPEDPSPNYEHLGRCGLRDSHREAFYHPIAWQNKSSGFSFSIQRIYCDNFGKVGGHPKNLTLGNSEGGKEFVLK